MKKILLLSIGLVTFPFTYCQFKEEHLQKSKHLKTTAWILTGTGAALTVGGTILIADGVLKENNNRNGDDQGKGAKQVIAGAGVSLLGLAAIGTSIPFFIRSHKEHKRALSFTFKNENIQLARNGKLARQLYPALCIYLTL